MKFLNKYLGHIFISSSLLFLVYLFFKSEIYWKGEKRDYYYIYFLLSFSIFIISPLIFYLNKNIKEYLIIILISFILSLYLINTYIAFGQTIIQKNYKVKLYKKETNLNYDLRTKKQIFLEKRKKEKITILTPTNYFEEHNIYALSGISKYETIHCNENGYYSQYLSDRYGFNNPDDAWDKKQIEYFIIGDSYIHGSCVNRPNDISSVLRTLSKKPVLNLGYSGNGPMKQFATLREYLIPNVKNILWVYYEGNDLLDLRNELKSDNLILNEYLKNDSFSQNLKKHQNKIDQLQNLYLLNMLKKNDVNFFREIFKFIKIYQTRYFLKRKFSKNIIEDEIFMKYEKILENVFYLSKKNNSKLFFIYIPAYERYKNGENFNYNRIKKIVNDLEIPFIDIDNALFKNEKNPLMFFPFELKNHYTVEGYKKISKAIYRLIINEKSK